MFNVSNVGTLKQFAVEIAFMPTVSMDGDLSKLSLPPQKGSGFFIEYARRYWLVTNLHNTEQETTEPKGLFEFELISIQSPSGGIIDIRNRQRVVPHENGTLLDLLAVEVFFDEIPKQIELVPNGPFQWGGSASNLPADFCFCTLSGRKFMLDSYYIIVGFPGNPTMNMKGHTEVRLVAGSDLLKVPHPWTRPYLNPPGKGASGAPVFQLINESSIELVLVHTYSYSLNIDGPPQISIDTGAGVQLARLWSAIDALQEV